MELRILRKDNEDKLQYRTQHLMIREGFDSGYEWTEWQDVPIVEEGA